MVYMVYLIILDTLPFLLILSVFILAWSILFEGLFFLESESFQSLQISFRTLFDFTIGNVDYSVF